LSNQPDFKDPFSDIPTDGPPMWEAGNEGKTPSDILSLLLGGDYKDTISVIMRTNFTADECMVIVRNLRRAKFGLGLIIKDENDKRWAMPWLHLAIVNLAMTRMSTGFHSVDSVVDALKTMKPKTEQTIQMKSL